MDQRKNRTKRRRTQPTVDVIPVCDQENTG